MLAAELKADVNVAKKGALLHDIGKAMDHDVQGTHVEIGRRILQKFNVDEKIIKAMQSHHEEYPFETTEAVIVQVADAISEPGRAPEEIHWKIISSAWKTWKISPNRSGHRKNLRHSSRPRDQSFRDAGKNIRLGSQKKWLGI